MIPTHADEIRTELVSGSQYPILGRAELTIVATIIGLSVYANLSCFVTCPADFRFFPPFRSGIDANENRHVGAEYFKIAQSLVAGRGYADPFGEPTGPTAWMPPVLPAILAALLWLGDGNRATVATAIVTLQILTLILTGLLVLAIAWDVARRAWLPALLLIASFLYEFHLCFQFTHDCWLVLLALDLLIAGLLWSRPFASAARATCWGMCGGLITLISPVVGFMWCVLTGARAFHYATCSRFMVAFSFAFLVILPWSARNYLVFGRVIPIKSNLPFELYQAQCMTRTGVIDNGTFSAHPYNRGTVEHDEYEKLGERAYLIRKRDQFFSAVRTDPLDYGQRVLKRLLAATLVYVPYAPTDGARPWILWFSRLVHPLPFLALLFLLLPGVRPTLTAPERAVICVYILYLMPYVLISYYERYAMPLIGVDAMLMVCALHRGLSINWRLLISGRFHRPERQSHDIACQ